MVGGLWEIIEKTNGKTQEKSGISWDITGKKWIELDRWKKQIGYSWETPNRERHRKKTMGYHERIMRYNRKSLKNKAGIIETS